MSTAQYNLNTKTDYLNRKMFLDPAGPVTIQRFEEVKYNKISDFEKTARGFFWVNISSLATCLGKLLLTVCKAAAQVKSLLRS